MIEITSWKEKRDSGTMVRMSTAEALRLIQSLSNQLVAGSENTGRVEFRTAKGEYFSVAVHAEEV